MNPMVTSKEKILSVCRELIRQEGWDAINIRSVAKACDVSVGTLYNYFHSKDDLSSAIVESVWRDIFHHENDMDAFADLPSCIQWLYRRLAYGARQYPNFLNLHALRFNADTKAQGRAQMEKVWEHMRENLCRIMQKDGNIRPGALGDALTAENFADVIFSLLLSSMIRQNYDPSAAMEIARRILYE